MAGVTGSVTEAFCSTLSTGYLKNKKKFFSHSGFYFLELWPSFYIGYIND